MSEAECGIPYDGAKEKYILDIEHGSQARHIVSLLEKAKEEGITALESGVLIQKLEEGRGKTGDKYRIWIPAKYAYGSTKMEDIPAWSTLEFDLELVKIAQL